MESTTLSNSVDFESLCNLETMFQEYGFDDGFRDGEKSGEIEGMIFGCEKSFELGCEVGFYQGCAETWKKLAEAYPDRINARGLKSIQALQSTVDSFPDENSQRADLYALKDKMMTKLRLLTSHIGVQQKFHDDPVAQELSY